VKFSVTKGELKIVVEVNSAVTERYVGVCAAKRPMQRTRCELFQNITNKMQRYTIYLFL